MSARNSKDGENPVSPINGTNASGPSSPSTPAKALPPQPASTAPAGPPKHVEEVMFSDIGVNTLLSRLKQSIASARDFAAFLKRRSSLEEEQAGGLKKLAKQHLDTVRRGESRSGSYQRQFEEVLRMHERLGDNGMQFALSLHQMHEDLNELSTNMEKGRKQWKHEGLDAEKRASDAEAAMYKAKSRYDELAEQYDRARTGDTKGSRRIGLKGPKSAEQYESDLQQKLSKADGEYQERVRAARSQREQLTRSDRPKAIKAITELIQECDSALTLQLQKFATFNEKLLLGNGLTVSPLNGDGPGNRRSLRDVIYDVDNEKDFHSYVGGYHGKIPARLSEIKYEQHPTQAPKTQQPSKPPSSFNTAQAQSTEPPRNPSVTTPVTVGTSATSPANGPDGRFGSQPQPGYGAGPTHPPPAEKEALVSPISPPYSAGPGPYSREPPYPMHPAERNAFQNGPGYPANQLSGTVAGAAAVPGAAAANRSIASQLPSGNTMSPSAQPNLAPLRPVFGISLDELFQRDQTAVPMVVYQCTQGIELFGLETEGIYRLSGISSHVNVLREKFNHSGGSAPDLDFRNPANFFHDVNSVATLLKQFFRDLPEPLFTNESYGNFIEAARIDDDIGRRDALHQRINDLPDPNYATLRAIVLHLARVIQHESRNRMTSSNLATCFAPTLMGAHTGPQLADAAFQARVVATILDNATAIFDED